MPWGSKIKTRSTTGLKIGNKSVASVVSNVNKGGAKGKGKAVAPKKRKYSPVWGTASNYNERKVVSKLAATDCKQVGGKKAKKVIENDEAQDGSSSQTQVHNLPGLSLQKANRF